MKRKSPYYRIKGVTAVPEFLNANNQDLHTKIEKAFSYCKNSSGLTQAEIEAGLDATLQGSDQTIAERVKKVIFKSVTYESVSHVEEEREQRLIAAQNLRIEESFESRHVFLEALSESLDTSAKLLTNSLYSDLKSERRVASLDLETFDELKVNYNVFYFNSMLAELRSLKVVFASESSCLTFLGSLPKRTQYEKSTKQNRYILQLNGLDTSSSTKSALKKISPLLFEFASEFHMKVYNKKVAKVLTLRYGLN